MRMRRLVILLPMLSMVALPEAGCGDSSSDPSPAQPSATAAEPDASPAPRDAGAPEVQVTGRVLRESHFTADPLLKAHPEDTLILHLEHPATPEAEIHEGDSSEAGVDTIPIHLHQPEPVRICTKSRDNTQHKVKLSAEDGSVLADMKLGDACKTVLLTGKNSTLAFQHDGSGSPSDGAHPIFVRTVTPGSPAWCELLGAEEFAKPYCSAGDTQALVSSIGALLPPALRPTYARYSNDANSVGNLDIGEVAVFENTAYQGRAWVFSEAYNPWQGSMSDFQSVVHSPFNLGSSISSVRLGPETTLIGYGKPGLLDYRSYIYECDAPDLTQLKTQNNEGVNDTIQSVFVKTNRTILISDRSCDDCDLKTTNFDNLNLTSVSAKRAKFNYASFRFATIADSDFTGAIFSNADFTNATLKNTIFKGGTLDSTNFQAARFQCASFAYADVSFAKFDSPPKYETLATGCRNSFDHAKTPFRVVPNTPGQNTWPFLDLSHVTITDMPAKPDWTGYDLKKSKIVAMQLPGATLTNSLWDGSDMTEVNLSEATLTSASFAETTLKGATLTYASAVGAVFSSAHLGADATTKGAVLSNANLTNARFDHADLTSAQLSNVILQGPQASVSGATLTLANFAGANLSSMDLSSANAQGAVFSNAILCYSKMKNTDLSLFKGGASNTGASLASSYLCGATLDGTNLRGADLTNAFVSVSGNKVKNQEGVLIDCPPATMSGGIVTDGATCPNGSPGPCSATAWTAPPPPPPPCCVSDGHGGCKPKIRTGFPCKDDCDCINGKCAVGKCN